MPLIPCPECRRDVSDRAETCPQCGYPLRKPASDRGPEASGADDELRRMVVGNPGRKIEAIKRCRELYPGMGLKEAKDHVESLEGVTGTPARTSRSGCLGVLVFLVAVTLGVFFLG